MDDDESLYGIIQFMAKRLGVMVSFAKTGEEAIAVYEKSLQSADPVGVIILDLNIDNGMGGMETIQKLMVIDPDVKAVVSSGDYFDPVMLNYRDFGFVDAISKPFNIENLNGVLAKAMNGKHCRS